MSQFEPNANDDPLAPASGPASAAEMRFHHLPKLRGSYSGRGAAPGVDEDPSSADELSPRQGSRGKTRGEGVRYGLNLEL